MSDDDGNIKPEWNIKYDDLEFGQLIGKGNFGKVYRGDYFGTDVAIKELLQTDDDEENKKYTDREVSMLTGVRHPNVVNFMGVAKRYKKGNEVYYLVTEWLPGGNLRKLLKNPEMHLSWKRRIEFARDTALAMNYLHQKNIIHRDLKSANLMLAADGSLKVCDFGLARRKNTKKSGLMTMAGTEEWMAPEIIVGDEYDEKCDVFSFGVVLYELITRQKPLPRGPATFFEFNLKDWNKNVPRDCPRKFSELALKCVDYYGKNRPTFKEIVKVLKELLQTEELQNEPLSPRTQHDEKALAASEERMKEELKKNMKKRLMEAEKQLKKHKEDSQEQSEEEEPEDLSVKKSSGEREKEKEIKNSKETEKKHTNNHHKGHETKKSKDHNNNKTKKEKGGGGKKTGNNNGSPTTKTKKKHSSEEEKVGGALKDSKPSTPKATKKNRKEKDDLPGEEKTAEALLTKYYGGSSMTPSKSMAVAGGHKDESPLATKKEKRKSWQALFHNTTTPTNTHGESPKDKGDHKKDDGGRKKKGKDKGLTKSKQN